MLMSDDEQELIETMERALRVADSLSLRFVAVKLSEAIDAFWVGKDELPPEG